MVQTLRRRFAIWPQYMHVTDRRQRQTTGETLMTMAERVPRPFRSSSKTACTNNTIW